jgi:hypothetical protein
MDGIVIRWEEAEFSNGTIEDQHGNWFRVRGETIEADSIGRRYLVIGEPASFDEGPVHVTQKGKQIRTAINIRRPFKEGPDPRTHREVCEVRDENWLARMKGGLLGIQRSDGLELYAGQVVRCGVEPPTQGTTWRAVNIEVIHEDANTFDWSSVSPDGEAVVESTAIPIVVPESILLTDRYRGRKLRNIKIKGGLMP